MSKAAKAAAALAANINAAQSAPVADPTVPAAVKVPGKRGRKSLDAAAKANMQASRVTATAVKGMLLPILQSDTVTDQKVWEGLPANQFAKIVTAIENTGKARAVKSAKQAIKQYTKATGLPAPAYTKPAKLHKVTYSAAEKAALNVARALATDETSKALLNERVADHRLFLALDPAHFAKIVGVTSALKVVMDAKSADSAKAILDAAMAAVGSKLVVNAAPARV